jgi:hypothetical protein
MLADCAGTAASLAFDVLLVVKTIFSSISMRNGLAGKLLYFSYVALSMPICQPEQQVSSQAGPVHRNLSV